MTVWLIHPRDPLIFRDGRPFTADPGARATSLAFPYPSTLAGAARTLSVPSPQPRVFDDSLVELLRKKSIRGPLLVEIKPDGALHWFSPAPADALILRKEKTAAVQQWLRPIELPKSARTNLDAHLKPVGARIVRKEKAHPDAPAFWRWERLEAWLQDPKDDENIKDISDLGLRNLAREYRTHVCINPNTQTANAGGLFQTSGLEFVWAGSAEKRWPLSQVKELSLALDTNADLRNTLGFLGGERRVAEWRKSASDLPACPQAIKERIKKEGYCRLILLTPAVFKQGYLPSWLLNQLDIQARVVSAVVPRYQTVSGWDYKENKPKITRRLAPAGSVYYLNLEGTSEQIESFVDAIWMHNVSDEAQDRCDGFGLAVLGTWDGSYVTMEVSDA